MQKNEIGPLPLPYTKIYSKWFTELNVKAKTIKFLGENIEVSPCDLELGNTKNISDKSKINWTT